MRLFMVLIGLGMALAACSTGPTEFHYWQKTDAKTALYLTGPKAQQMLEEDIALCVHQIIELTKIEEIRDGVPPIMSELDGIEQGKVTTAMDSLPTWETPERIKDLRVNHSDFHDFEGCMREQGWERVKYVFPGQEEHAKKVYYEHNK